MICPSCNEEMDEALSRMGLALHPTCDALDLDPDLVVTDIFTTVADHIANQPRNHQKMIGPSEIGHPCTRRIAYKLAGTPEVNSRGVAWKPYVGTSVHEQVANIMAREEVTRAAAEEFAQRWHVEERVSVGEIDGEEVTGSCDLFDAHGGIAWDWKFTSTNMIRRTYKPKGPGDQYRVQAHLYGRGWQRAGHPVKHVGVIFLTRDGEFTDRFVWHEPYDEQVAVDALARVETIAVGLRVHGPEVMLPLMPAVEAYCGNCPFYNPLSQDLTKSCPGVDKEGNTITDPLDAMFT